MKKILLTMLLCLSNFIAFTQYTTYSGKFSIDFPKVPNEKIDKNNIVTLLTYDENNTLYAVIQTNTHVKFEKGKTSDFLDATKKAFMEGYGGSIKKEFNYVKDGWTGKEMTIIKNIEGREVWLYYRVIFYSDRMYQIMYMSPLGEDSINANKFFKSFNYLQ